MTEETRKLLELIEKAGCPVSLQQCIELPVFTGKINAAKTIRSQVQNLHRDGHISRVGRGLYAPVRAQSLSDASK